jgi:predicted RNA-binding Zn-ribbon protein involved in translation (DUF1610 family)
MHIEPAIEKKVIAMPDLKEIRTRDAGNGLHTCPACGYQLGFHTSFVKTDAKNALDPVSPASELYRIILICPECGARYDPGWKAPLNK